jgi:hypothetical protein
MSAKPEKIERLFISDNLKFVVVSGNKNAIALNCGCNSHRVGERKPVIGTFKPRSLVIHLWRDGINDGKRRTMNSIHQSMANGHFHGQFLPAAFP